MLLCNNGDLDAQPFDKQHSTINTNIYTFLINSNIAFVHISQFIEVYQTRHRQVNKQFIFLMIINSMLFALNDVLNKIISSDVLKLVCLKFSS